MYLDETCVYVYAHVAAKKHVLIRAVQLFAMLGISFACWAKKLVGTNGIWSSGRDGSSLSRLAKNFLSRFACQLPHRIQMQKTLCQVHTIFSAKKQKRKQERCATATTTLLLLPRSCLAAATALDGGYKSATLRYCFGMELGSEYGIDPSVSKEGNYT
jgi:hypothetical protein